MICHTSIISLRRVRDQGQTSPRDTPKDSIGCWRHSIAATALVRVVLRPWTNLAPKISGGQVQECRTRT